MRMIKWCWMGLINMIKFPFSGWKNSLFFVLSLPAMFVFFLLSVYLTNWINPFFYKAQKDKDSSGPAYEYDVIYLDQGWDQGYRQKFYFTPQGSHIIPLEIALALESPSSRDPNSPIFIFGENGTAVTKFGYMPYPVTRPNINPAANEPHSHNPYGLPIGFTDDKDRHGRSMLGINCAGCHASNMKINGKTVRIDGGAALADFMGLLREIDTALVATIEDEAKLERFAGRLVGKNIEAAKDMLEVASVKRQGWQRRNGNDLSHKHGFARVDAFGIIFNQVVARDLHLDTPEEQGGNIRKPVAPASYPVLWDTPYMGRVQWTGGSNNLQDTDPLARNIGQVLGVFGGVELTTQNSLPGMCSTPKRKNLELYNFWLQSLKSPKWTDPRLGSVLPALDPELVARGKLIYNGGSPKAGRDGKGEGCAGCHAVVNDSWRDSDAITKQVCDVPVKMISHDIVGTDRELIDTGRRKGAKTGELAGLPSQLFPGKTIRAEEDFMVMLGEMIMGSFAGSYLSGTCDGEWSVGNLVETANTYGYFAKKSSEMKKKKSQKTDVKELTSGGFALGDNAIETAQTNLNSARAVLRGIPANADIPDAYRALAKANVKAAEANLAKAYANLELSPEAIELLPDDPKFFGAEFEAASANLTEAENLIKTSRSDLTISPEVRLLVLSNRDIARQNMTQAQANLAPDPAEGVEECPTSGRYSSYAYKARPLNGIWASAPYLHNGSVPTLYDMLLPPTNEKGVCEADQCRPDIFYVGSNEFDWGKVGFNTKEDPRWSMFDTSKKGNSNEGHTFYQKDLTHEDRMALIEYLKSL